MMSFLANKIPLTILLCVSALSVILGDAFAKTWSINQRTGFLVLAFAGYFFSSLFYIPSLLKEGLVVTSIVWSVISTLGFLAVGLFIFHEHLTKGQMIGVALGVLSLLVFAVAEK